MPAFDVVVVGAGILGLATARELLARRPTLRVTMVDKERAIGQHQTGHNSGVIHSGLYYAPGTLKAQLCVQGGAALRRYCDERGIPYERCGKVVVATRPEELPALEELHRRGLANGVADLEMIGPERLRELEPHVVGLQALWSPNTGIIDFSIVARSYADDIEQAGGVLRLGEEVRGVSPQPGETVVETSIARLTTRSVIACAGLQADRLAALSGAPRDPRIVPFRGDYFVLPEARRYLVRSLVYPVPDPAFPFLGVHFTRRPDGDVWLGPNAVLAFAREGYRLSDINPVDLLEVFGFKGFRTLVSRYWKTGLAEMWRDVNKGAFLRSLQVFVPELTIADLLPGPSGVRAQALDASGTLVDDFVVHEAGGVLHVRNAPSPAATSSLGIARLIADRWEQMVPA